MDTKLLEPSSRDRNTNKRGKDISATVTREWGSRWDTPVSIPHKDPGAGLVRVGLTMLLCRCIGGEKGGACSVRNLNLKGREKGQIFRKGRIADM